VSGATIRRVDVARCVVPTRGGVRVGHQLISAREYAVVRIATAEGLTGSALGHTRGVPVAEALALLAPTLLGRDAFAPAALVESLATTNPYGRGSLVRATSLLDVALYDLLAKRAELPLYRLLGGARNRVPLLVVGGYSGDAGDELRRLADDGFRSVKVHIDCDDPAEDAAYAARLQAAVGPGVKVAVDAHMAWRNLAEALAGCRPLDGLGLAFIEDPFPPDCWRLTGELQSRLATPLAAGEDVLGLQGYRDLVEAVTILRVDATSSGGIGTVTDAAALARAAGRAAMTHAFPDLHGQVAGGLGAVGLVEMIPYESGANPVGELMVRRQRVEDGELVLDEEPGNGFPLDWEAVLRRAEQTWTIDEED
jgi:L-alanine-DL-glutamate epimerase-like enolase superfamily enzyme